MPTRKIRKTALLSDAINAELEEVAAALEAPVGAVLNQCVVLGLRQMQRIAFPQRTLPGLAQALVDSGIDLEDMAEAMKGLEDARSEAK